MAQIKRYIRVTVHEVTETEVSNSIIPEFEQTTMLINNYPIVISNFAYEKHEKLDDLIYQALVKLQ